MASTFFLPHIGGIEYHVLNVSRHLVNNGHRVTVVTSLIPKVKPLEKLDDIEIVRIKTHFLPGRIHRSLSSVGFAINAEKTILRIAKKENIDLIHAHGHHYPLTWSALNAAHELNIPSVLTIHGMYALSPTNFLAKAVEEIFNRTVFVGELRKASAVIGLTPTITDFARNYGSPFNGSFTIPNGVDTKIYRENSKKKIHYREKYGIPRRKVVVLFRGRFSRVKGVLEFAEVAKRFSQRNNQFFFVFVGGGPLHEKLKDALKAAGANYKIMNWTPNDEVHELYIASDIYVLPSKWEALPITLIEAMASSLHIVATPVGGIADVLADYPWKTYIEGFSSNDIAAALMKALHSICSGEHDSDDFDVARYDWSCISREIANVYEAFVKSN
jgi:glycosyltransferase involved in cell wall biosynthesis